MITTKDVEIEARTWLGTPFHHQGRLKGVGVDCVGLLVGVAHHFGIDLQDHQNYQRFSGGDQMVKELDKRLIRLEPGQEEPGDYLVFWLYSPDFPMHGAFKTEHGMLHASDHVNRIVENVIDGRWASRISRYYRLPTVQPFWRF